MFPKEKGTEIKDQKVCELKTFFRMFKRNKTLLFMHSFLSRVLNPDMLHY